MTNDRGASCPSPVRRLGLDRSHRGGASPWRRRVLSRCARPSDRQDAARPITSSAMRAPASAEGDRKRFILDTQEGLTYVAEQTGGIAALNTNDIGAGHRARRQRHPQLLHPRLHAGREHVREPGKTPRLHKISLKVKRPGLTVRTRKTFLGISDPPAAPKIASVGQELRDAALSPFTASDISMRATTLPGYGPDGAFVRTLLEIDARALSFAKGDDGRTTADVDVVGMAFDQDGTEVGHMTTAFTVALSADMDPEALREGEGLVYVLKVPIPKPGAYQIRFSAGTVAAARSAPRASSRGSTTSRTARLRCRASCWGRRRQPRPRRSRRRGSTRPGC